MSKKMQVPLIGKLTVKRSHRLGGRLFKVGFDIPLEVEQDDNGDVVFSLTGSIADALEDLANKFRAEADIRPADHAGQCDGEYAVGVVHEAESYLSAASYEKAKRGGFLPNGQVYVVENRSGKPERILTAGEWEKLRNGA